MGTASWGSGCEKESVPSQGYDIRKSTCALQGWHGRPFMPSKCHDEPSWRTTPLHGLESGRRPVKKFFVPTLDGPPARKYSLNSDKFHHARTERVGIRTDNNARPGRLSRTCQDGPAPGTKCIGGTDPIRTCCCRSHNLSRKALASRESSYLLIM
ncbi:hypothetical protein LX36DRAFT_653554, partial [Colletotrichum falcatum]